MAIQEIRALPSRREICFVGDDPPDDAVAELRFYELTKVVASDLTNPNRLASMAAIIFLQRKDKPLQIARDLEAFAYTLLAHDCRVFAVPVLVEPGDETPRLRSLIVGAIDSSKLPVSGLAEDEAETLGDWYSGISAQQLTPMVHVLDRSDAWQRLAELLGAYPPGLPPHFGLEIEAVTANGNSIDMPFEQRVMVQRAFWNCSKVRLVANSDGRSGVGTFHAYAHPHADVVGSHRPYEYFVKIGSRVQISREYLAYRESALEHIPYHLGPRLRLDRCALGPHQGIIVSDYVSGAEKLRDCARDGRAVPVIASLFNTTLRNWRDASTKVDRSLQDYLSDRMPCEIPTHRKLRVRELGGTKTPAELSKLWLARASRPVQVGFVHGDLHALNVMVRNGDAIVIDFEKVKGSAPLLLDLASLEGGLFVDGFVGDLRDGQSLMRSIEQLYQVETLLDGRFEQCHPSDGSAWFFDCVSQIRLQARQIELDRGQYALTLATELTKKACKEVDFNKENGSSAGALTGEDVRALAYVIAERILIEISSDPVKLIER